MLVAALLQEALLVNADLFRKEALEHQGERLQGDLILSQPVSYSLLSALFSIIVLITIIFLCQNDYYRKQTVSGYLVPNKGMITVTAPKESRLTNVSVEQDASVEVGAALLTLEPVEVGNGTSRISAQALKNLLQQEQSIINRIALEQRNVEVLNEKNIEEKNSLIIQASQQQELINNEEKILLIKQSALDRATLLYQQKLLSIADYDAVYSMYLEQNKVVQVALSKESKLESELNTMDKRIELSSLSSLREITLLEEQLTQLHAEKIRINADNVNHIHSPIAGKVASINIQNGQLVQPHQTILSLIPEGSILQVELYVPSSAIGFLNKDQQINIRYEAFPFQKFGVHQATIEELSKTILLPTELPKGLTFKEPVYRVIASLNKQTVAAFGENRALRSGMVLSADVMIEKRSLLEWLLEPLLSIKG